MRTIAVTSEKGGVGKTATACNLAGILAIHGNKTLLVDTDPQAYSSSYYECFDPREPGVYEVMRGFADAKEIIKKTVVDNLYLLPCNGTMEAIESDLAAMPVGQEMVLLDALDKIADEYDYCIIDTPPAGMRTKVNVYVAANDLIITTIPDDYAMYGLTVLLRRLQGITRSANPSLRVLGVLPTLMEQTVNKKNNLEALRNQTLAPVFQTVIRKNTDIANAITCHVPVTEYNPACNGAADYEALVAELMPALLEPVD